MHERDVFPEFSNSHRNERDKVMKQSKEQRQEQEISSITFTIMPPEFSSFPLLLMMLFR
jgi:hypothetical protein